MAYYKTRILSGTSSASASTTTVTTGVGGFGRYNWFDFYAVLTGATGGTLDVYVQNKLADDVWADYIHFAQLSAGGSAKVRVSPQPSATITTIGTGTDAAPGVALAAGTCVGGDPGETMRLVFVTGSGVSVAGSATIYVGCHTE